MTEQTQIPADRAPVIALAYEVIAGDWVVDTWEGTSREVAAVDAGPREVTVHFTEGDPETSTQRPGGQRLYDVWRRRSAMPEPTVTSWTSGG